MSPDQYILQARPWAYDDIGDDYRSYVDCWRECTEEFANQALEVLPPIYVSGGFMVSEPYTHEGNAGVYALVAKVGARHFTRYSTRAKAPAYIAALHAHLAKKDA